MSDRESAAERVAYVPRSALEGTGALERGFTPDSEGSIYRRVTAEAEFAPRPQLEEDPSRKQLIPYVILRERSRGRLFTMWRRSAQSESRLHHNLSIGAGGHIAMHGEAGAADPIRAGMERELHEELEVPEPMEITYRGLLNDDDNEVGRVHLGLVYSARVDCDEVAVREVEKMEGAWKSLERLAAESERLESWSHLLLDPLRRERI